MTRNEAIVAAIVAAIPKEPKHEGFKRTVEFSPGAPPPCPCGRMTVNDCAGECGFTRTADQSFTLTAWETEEIMDGWPIYGCLDQQTGRET